MCTMYGVLSHFMLFCSRISFFVIYAVLSRNIYLAIHALLRGEKFKKKMCPSLNLNSHIPFLVQFQSPHNYQTLVAAAVEIVLILSHSLIAFQHHPTTSGRSWTHLCRRLTTPTLWWKNWIQLGLFHIIFSFKNGNTSQHNTHVCCMQDSILHKQYQASLKTFFVSDRWQQKGGHTATLTNYNR